MLMEILGMSETRFFTIYIAQGVLFAFFTFLAYKILKRDRKRLNLIFSLFYITAAIGLSVNFIYGPLNDPIIVYLLNYITNCCLFFAPIFLLLFSLILLKSEKVITTQKQLIVIIVYGILIAMMILFPWGDPEWGINMETPQSPPDWSLPYYIYITGIMSIFASIPTLRLCLSISKEFEDPQLKKKWKFFILGYVFVMIFTYGIMTSNMLNIPTLRTVMGLIGLILAIFGGYLLYYGVGKQIEK